MKRINKRLLSWIISVTMVIVTLSFLITPYVKIWDYNKEPEDISSRYIPNDPTWMSVGNETLYIDGYIPYSEMFVGGELDVDKFSNSFTYDDSDNLHHPSTPQKYEKWFTTREGGQNLILVGGREFDADFMFDIENQPPNEVGVSYYVEEIKFNELKIFWEYGRMSRITLSDDALSSLFEVLPMPDWFDELQDVINMVESWIYGLIIPWSPIEPDWWNDYPDLPEWPEEEPPWWDELPGLIWDAIVDTFSGASEEIAKAIACAIAVELLWFGLGKVPVIGAAFTLFHKFFELGVVWKLNESLSSGLIHNGNGEYIYGLNHEVIDGKLHIRPTTYGSGEEVWEPIFQFNNNFFNEDDPNKNEEPITLEYYWRERDNVVKLRMQNVMDYKLQLPGLNLSKPDWTFINAIDINSEQKVVYEDSYYRLDNDVFGDYDNQNEYYRETQDNLFNARADEIEDYWLPKNKFGTEMPFFSRNNTYNDIERYILENKLLVSRDKIQDIDPTNFELIFYDQYGIEIDKTQNIEESIIRFSVSSKGVNTDINGTTDILIYEIPFINIREVSYNKNIFDYSSFSNLPIDNESKASWEYDSFNDKWTLKTNVQLLVDLFYDDGVDKVIIDYEDEFDIIEDFNDTNPGLVDISIPYYQTEGNEVVDGQHISVELFDKSLTQLDNGRGVKFELIYSSTPNDSNLSIIDSIGNEVYSTIKYANIDSNDSSVFPYEIYDVISTTDNLYITSEYDIDRYQLVGSEWIYKDTNTSFTTNENGVFGYSVIDLYGNNLFVVVEKLGVRENTQFNDWIGSEEYLRNKEYFLEQELSTEDKFNSFGVDEYRHVNLMVNSGYIPDIVETLIEQPLNQLEIIGVTNDFNNNGSTFGESVVAGGEKISMKEALKNEINKQMLERGFEENQYQITWNNVNDNTLMNNDIDKIEYSIIPEGNWNSINGYSSTIKLMMHTSINDFKANELALSSITGRFNEGTKFGEVTVNTIGETTSIRSELEKEIKKELFSYGVQEEYLNSIEVEWKINGISNNVDDISMEYGDSITYRIYSSGIMVKGESVGILESQTRIDLSLFEINTLGLSEVTNEYFNGAIFGGDYSEFGVSGNIKEDLENEIYNQLSQYGVLPTQVEIEFFNEMGISLGEYSPINSGDIIEYKVYSISPKYFGEISGQFTVMTFESLDALRLPKIELMKITNKYESGSEFSKMKDELDTYMLGYLTKKGIQPSYVEVDWNTNNDTIVNFDDLITLEITSTNFDYIKGKASESFTSMQYFDLDNLTLDLEYIQDEFESNVGIVFGDISERLNKYIIQELSSQGYNTSIINIQWSIAEEEVITNDRVVNLHISGISEQLVHNPKTYQFLTPPSEGIKDNSVNWIWFAIALLCLLVLMLLIAIVIYIKNNLISKDEYDE